MFGVTDRIPAWLTVLATALCLACGSEDSETLPSLKSVEVPEACADLPVDRFRELMVVDERLQALIHNRAPEQELIAAARAAGLRAMREDGERLVRSGVTSEAEVIRVTRD